MKYFYMYKIINNHNGKFYIGVRSSKKKPEDDKYMGSGKRLKDAYKCYGKNSFSKIVMEIFENSIDMFAKEAEIVNEEFVNDPMTYNMCLGGFGGDHWSYLENREDQINKRRETKKKSDTALTVEQRKQKYSRTHWIGRKHKESTLQKQSDIHSYWQYTCIDPSGKVHTFKSLRKFCTVNNLNADVFRKYANSNIPIPPYTRGPKNPSRVNSTGWIINRSPLKHEQEHHIPLNNPD